MQKAKIYIKTEANINTGGGHLHRDIILADILKKLNISTEFIFAETNPKLINSKLNNKFKHHLVNKQNQYNAETYLKIMSPHSLILFDTDDYKFYSGQLIDNLRQNNIKTACFTITDKYYISTDILINSNIIGLIQKFRTAEYTKKLLGPKYLIFNPKFSKTDNFLSEKTDDNILIFFGNSDKNNFTNIFLEVLTKIENKFSAINVILGAINPHSEQILKHYKNSSKIKIHQNLSVSEMINLYSSISLGLTSGGMTMWEMALFEIPQIVVATSEREKIYTDYLHKKKYIYKIADYDKFPATSLLTEQINYLLTDMRNWLKIREFRNQISPDGAENISKILKKTIEE